MKEAQRFTKKPVTITAIKWTGNNLAYVIHFTDGRMPLMGGGHAGMKWEEYSDLVDRDGLKIFTLEGKMNAQVGDWIIRGVKGELYPCKPDIFELTYEQHHGITGATPTPTPIKRKALEAKLCKYHKNYIGFWGTLAGEIADMLAADAQEIADLQQELDQLKTKVVTCQTYGHVVGACAECNTWDEINAEAQQVAVPQDALVADLSMMVRRLVLAIRRNVDDPHKDLTLANDCLNWLTRKGLAGSPLRDTVPQPPRGEVK